MKNSTDGLAPRRRAAGRRDGSRAGSPPRVVVRLTGGMVSVFCESDLSLTVVDDDIEVRCDSVVHLCDSADIDDVLAETSWYRFDAVYCALTSRGVGPV